MNIALISYPSMLPQFENAIPKPPKKRYRDLFQDKQHNISTIGINNYPYDSASVFAVNDENVINCAGQLHRAVIGCKYRQSVIKHSHTVSQRISVEIEPKFRNDVTKVALGMHQTDEVEYSSSSLSSSSSSSSSLSSSSEDSSDSVKSSPPHHKYLSSKNFLIDSAAVEFAGKLKVKWREKYENLESGYESVEGRFGEKTATTSGRKTALRNSSAKRRNLKKNAITERTSETISDVLNQPPSSSLPTVRKLERVRKGLIYQKFMADSYTRNRKEKNSKTVEDTQSRKRGRPKTVKSNSRKYKLSADDGSKKPPSITQMKLDREKNGRALKYTLVDSKNQSPSMNRNKKQMNTNAEDSNRYISPLQISKSRVESEIEYSDQLCKC